MKKIFPNDLQAIFLDFDGVIVESANIKTEAFYELYLPYGSAVAQQAMNFHKNHQGVSRYKKFQEIHKNFLGKNCDPEEKEKLSKEFSKIVLDKIMSCPFVDGVLGFLKRFQDKNIPVFLLSATPHEELLYICEQRKISFFFRGIYGAPFEKAERVETLVRDFCLMKKNTIFIGDSSSDFKAAQEASVPFIGRVEVGNKNPFCKQTLAIENFLNLG